MALFGRLRGLTVDGVEAIASKMDAGECRGFAYVTVSGEEQTVQQCADAASACARLPAPRSPRAPGMKLHGTRWKGMRLRCAALLSCASPRLRCSRYHPLSMGSVQPAKETFRERLQREWAERDAPAAQEAAVEPPAPFSEKMLRVKKPGTHAVISVHTHPLDVARVNAKKTALCARVSRRAHAVRCVLTNRVAAAARAPW